MRSIAILLAMLGAPAVLAQPPAARVAPAAAAPPPAATPASAEADAATHVATDQSLRLTVPVAIDGHGPFDFIVDTGSDRSVVSRDVATRLALPATELVTMHSVIGVQDVATVRIDTLTIAGRTTRAIAAPALDGGNIGADGLLGIDALKGRRIVIDFAAHTLTIRPPGEREPVLPDTIVVTARSRYGQLVLVDADVDGTPVTVILDTGAQASLGNLALRRLLERRRSALAFAPLDLVDVTGSVLTTQVAHVPRVRIGGVTLDRVGIAFADAHPFRRFGLLDRPALMMGIQTLRAFRRVSIDFATRRVRIQLRKGGEELD